MMIGQSPAFQTFLSQLRRFAGCDAPVLLEGETGTGKELAAREIHYGSARRHHPFVPINCGGLPDTLVESELFGHRRGAFTDAKTSQPGLIESARGGTLFLDEVDSLSQKAQVSLLRFLQDSHYRPVGGTEVCKADVRVVAATNADLEACVNEGAFRRDLFYRLNSLHIRVPPLRERRSDIPLLAAHFLDAAAQRLRGNHKTWSERALGVLSSYAWPGNVRELDNVVFRAYLHAEEPVVELQDIGVAAPAVTRDVDAAWMDICNYCGIAFSAAKSQAVAHFERRYLTDLLRRTEGNVSAAARLSGTERRQLGKLLKKHHIESKRFRTHEA
ncbi:sigma-54 interaction domain-containing protein [Tahibacter amnicola]|uniref:Sigma-54 dependent transcriptional regulator n=1 Tax=Tahibacter amnicola TaxID=2976241 RepID=A0ABY6BA82_9GAMM|nr:sigma-54 dependent transcriptional regulator [Tahibacter amnicola]UXI66457.1 sigma-54 dependent transcriptional regulator [Tahibacter amnicola]